MKKGLLDVVQISITQTTGTLFVAPAIGKAGLRFSVLYDNKGRELLNHGSLDQFTHRKLWEPF